MEKKRRKLYLDPCFADQGINRKAIYRLKKTLKCQEARSKTPSDEIPPDLTSNAVGKYNYEV